LWLLLLLLLLLLLQVCDPRVLFSGRHDLREKAGKQPLGSWMWDGMALDAALDKFATEGAVHEQGCLGCEFLQYVCIARAKMLYKMN
jgi:hypothetical protein